MTDVQRQQKRDEIMRRMCEMRHSISFSVKPEDDPFLRLHRSLDRVAARLDLLLDLMYLDHPELVDFRINAAENTAAYLDAQPTNDAIS